MRDSPPISVRASALGSRTVLSSCSSHRYQPQYSRIYLWVLSLVINMESRVSRPTVARGKRYKEIEKVERDGERWREAERGAERWREIL